MSPTTGLGHSTVKVMERYSHPENSIQLAVKILANFGLIVAIPVAMKNKAYENDS